MRFLGLRSAAAAAIALFFALLPGHAAAGLFDSFGASYQRQPATGRHLVAFPPGYEPGTVIVQFSQRRLYYVLPQQRAISYPIGAPKGDARWSGDTYVSAKKVNPGWTPTAEMRRENPTLPAHVPGGHPKNPLGVRALYLGKTMYRIHGTVLCGKGPVKTKQSFAKLQAKIGEFAGFFNFCFVSLFTLEASSLLYPFNLYLTGDC